MRKVTQSEMDERTLESARQSAYRRIHQAHTDALAELRDRFPQTEREGWHELVQDAKEGNGECIENYATELGVSVNDAITRVLSAREGYRKAYGTATGKLTNLRDLVDSSESIEELESINW